MKIPKLTIEQLLEAGVHLGHKTLRWNPKMKKYIFGKRDSIHIIDLTQTLELTKVALEKVHEVISNNGKILFISTKKQASDAIAELAKDTDQYYVNYRWLGGMLTNWCTISNSIKKLDNFDSFFAFIIVSLSSEQYKSIDLLASSFPGIGKSIPSGFEFVSKTAIIGIPSFMDSLIANDS